MCSDEDRRRFRNPPEGGTRSVAPRRASVDRSRSPQSGSGAPAAGGAEDGAVAGTPVGGAAGGRPACRRANRYGQKRRQQLRKAAARRQADRPSSPVRAAGDVPSPPGVSRPSTPSAVSSDDEHRSGDGASSSVSAGVAESADAAEHATTAVHESAVNAGDAPSSEPVSAAPAADPAAEVASVAPAATEADAGPLGDLDAIVAAVRLIHDDDFTVCECPGLYCRRGCHPYCAECHRAMQEPCVHLLEYAQGLDFDC